MRAVMGEAMTRETTMRATRSASWIRNGQEVLTQDGERYKATADSDDANLWVEVTSPDAPRHLLAYHEIRAIFTIHQPTGRVMTIPVNEDLD
jgi:hypothetical protein